MRRDCEDPSPARRASPRRHRARRRRRRCRGPGPCRPRPGIASAPSRADSLVWMDAVVRIVDADHDMTAAHRSVRAGFAFTAAYSFHRAVTVDVVGRDIASAPTRRARGRATSRSGRTRFPAHRSCVRSAARDRGPACRYCRRSPRRNLPAFEDMADQCRRRRLAVGAGDGDDGRAAGLRRIGPDLAGEQFDVADDSAPPRARVTTISCGLGWVSGTPGLSTSAFKRSQGHFRNTALSARRPARAAARPALAVVPRQTRAPPAFNAATDESPSAPGRRRQRQIGEGAGRDHRYLSFNVERPTSASTTEMIQKRMTMVGSFQPSCSK